MDNNFKKAKKIKIKLYDDPITCDISINMAIYDDNGKMYLAQPVKLEFKLYEPMTIIDKSFIQMPYFHAQEFLSQLSNALIEMGYRDKLTNADSEIKRMENHIKDLQKVLDKHLEG